MEKIGGKCLHFHRNLPENVQNANNRDTGMCINFNVRVCNVGGDDTTNRRPTQFMRMFVTISH